MMKFLQSLLIFTFLATPIVAQEPIRKSQLPKEVKVEFRSSTVPKEIEGKQWNQWTSKNFTVLALNDTQAEYLHKHLEHIKSWTLARWGFYDIDFSKPCMLLAVDDPVLFEKLFKIKKTRVEVRRDSSGKIERTIIFLLASGSPSHTVPVPLSEIVVAEFAQKYNAKFGWWSSRGMSILNGTLAQIRAELRDLKPLLENNKPLYFSEGLLTMTREQYIRLSPENQALFDKSAMCFCLLLRKEFGQDKMHLFLKRAAETNGEAALKEVLGFDGYDQFDRSFKRYMLDLTRDILSGKTPDHYLQIRARGVKASSSFFSSSS